MSETLLRDDDLIVRSNGALRPSKRKYQRISCA